MSKSRVAPLKPCTIPRLELQAAVLAVKIDTYLRQVLDLHIIHSMFWSDSEIVLKYIANESRRFHVFVANRVSVTTDNLDNDMWLRGPQFLSVHKCYWESGEEPSCELSPNDPEVRKKSASVTVSAVLAQSHNDQDRFHSGIIDRVIAHYSPQSKMKGALTWPVLYIAFLRGSRDDSKLLVEHGKTTEQILIRDSQRKMFPDDIHDLSVGKPVKYNSSLCALNPFVDQHGIIRVGGRIKEAMVENKHPCVIHAKHAIGKAVVHDAHNVGHFGVEWSLSVIKKHFWMVKARPLIKQVIKSCVTCRQPYAKPCVHHMTDLPQDRLVMNKPAFTIIGLDSFGPFAMKYGFRRFVAHQGQPRNVLSD